MKEKMFPTIVIVTILSILVGMGFYVHHTIQQGIQEVTSEETKEEKSGEYSSVNNAIDNMFVIQLQQTEIIFIGVLVVMTLVFLFFVIGLMIMQR